MAAGLLAWLRDVDRLEIHGSEVIRWDVFLKANYGKLHWVKGDFFVLISAGTELNFSFIVPGMVLHFGFGLITHRCLAVAEQCCNHQGSFSLQLLALCCQ